MTVGVRISLFAESHPKLFALQLYTLEGFRSSVQTDERGGVGAFLLLEVMEVIFHLSAGQDIELACMMYLLHDFGHSHVLVTGNGDDRFRELVYIVQDTVFLRCT
jgi:hypothetical protein